jgi:hypothetical protein
VNTPGAGEASATNTRASAFFSRLPIAALLTVTIAEAFTAYSILWSVHLFSITLKSASRRANFVRIVIVKRCGSIRYAALVDRETHLRISLVV